MNYERCKSGVTLYNFCAAYAFMRSLHVVIAKGIFTRSITNAFAAPCFDCK